jgi:hypothetical protein
LRAKSTSRPSLPPRGGLPPCGGPHLSDDQLLESYVLAVDEGHLSACGECRARFDNLVRALDELREDAVSEADAVFTTERLHEQRERIIRRLERHGHPADVLTFPSRLGSHQAARRLLGPARRWVAGAAVAGLVAGLFLGFAVDRRVGSISARRAGNPAAPAAAWNWQQASAEPQDEQVLTEIEDVLAGPHRLLEMRVLDAMTTPPELQKEASFDLH